MPAAHLAYANRDWAPQPSAEAACTAAIANARAANPELDRYAGRLHAGTGVKLRDIVDHLELAPAALARLEAAGWVEDSDGAWRNPAGMFPPALPADGPERLWLRCENVAQAVAALAVGTAIEGVEHSALRRAVLFAAPAHEAGFIERGGAAEFAPAPEDAATIRAGRLHLQFFRARRRQFDTPARGLDHTEALVGAAVRDLGPHRACALWLTAEREYWMRRCPAGALQKARQDAAGIGWANIDHHTYDGSREHFAQTVRILETLGYGLREMLYMGAGAGWGSQILEQPAIGSTIFADVDLAPHEVDIDFAHMALPPLEKHRRAGILSVLHGESMLEGGLNHVAALYDQRALRAQLAEAGQAMMRPFSDLPFLYQELTLGDVAAVDPARADALQAAGHLTAAEAENIRLNGYIAAHLENIERGEGYKGFNKPGIDGVLRALDPRAAVRETVAAAA